MTDVTTFEFLAFALAAGLLYNIRSSVFWRQTILLSANVVFVGALAANWKSYIPLAMFMGGGYTVIRLMQNRRARKLFVPLLGVIILLFVWLKRYTFLPHNFLLPFPYVTIGLSYIFFRVVHLIVDTREEALAKPIGIVPYLTYTLNFTTLVAGPIQLYPQFASSQLRTPRPPLTLAQGALALERVVIGLFKVRVLSSILLAVQQAALARLNGGQALLQKTTIACVILAVYPTYLYFNFSGYVDLMIGVGRLFRLDLPENFDRPFSSTSFIEFWSRWHMTLSSWWKTYVYAPLVKALMSRFPAPHLDPFLGVAGFFITFFFVGVWHGQTSEFLCFGLLQGGGVSMNKLYQILLAKAVGRKRFKSLATNSLYCALCRGLTFTYFTLTLIWFWSSWSQIRRLATALTLGQEMLVWTAIWLGSAVSLTAWEALRRLMLGLQWEGTSVMLSAPVRTAWAVYIMILTLTALSIVTVPTQVLYQIF